MAAADLSRRHARFLLLQDRNDLLFVEPASLHIVRLLASDSTKKRSHFRGARHFLFEEFGGRSFYEPEYPEDAMLVFGQETKGLPRSIIERHSDRLFRLPMRSDVIRSLNLANTVSAAAYQALRGRI
ncbi:TrmH family RNA methyltransferase [Erythrobacter aurantius]|uniref:TrmH family RNA methyltransferase n=1 Tax=Erythrobacter aurantius TaxID=2909249 RepID=UPI002079E987|nr:TrmH family RNA methyltransferase [Erythrobacter aurantius]